MSTIGGLGNSLATQLLQWQQNLFKKLDTNGDGTLTKTELEQDVTAAGGTTASADALYAELDPDDTGSVTEQQFEANFPPPSFSPEMGAQFIADQAQRSGTSSDDDPATQFAASLFDQLDTNGDGTLTKSELEAAVTSAGGTTASADALYAELDPDNTGEVTEEQFVANFPQPDEAGNGATTSTTSDGGTSAADAVSSLLQSFAPSQMASALFAQIDTNGDGTLTKSELEAAVTDAGGTTASADALYAELDPDDTGKVTEQQFAAKLSTLGTTTDQSNSSTSSDSGTSAADAMAALLQNLVPPLPPLGPPPSDTEGQSASTSGSTSTGTSAEDAVADLLNADAATSGTASNGAASTGTTSGATDSTPAVPFGKYDQQILALISQLQAAGELN